MNEHCHALGSLFGLCPKRGRREPRYNLLFFSEFTSERGESLRALPEKGAT